MHFYSVGVALVIEVNYEANHLQIIKPLFFLLKIMIKKVLTTHLSTYLLIKIYQRANYYLNRMTPYAYFLYYQLQRTLLYRYVNVMILEPNNSPILNDIDMVVSIVFRD